MDDWLVDERRELSAQDAGEESRTAMGFAEGPAESALAVVLRDAKIHNTRRLFGRADVRIDALFVTASSATELFHPKTWMFSGVRDHDRLPIDESGMALYFGQPRYFLDMALIASKGSDDRSLGELLQQEAEAVGDLLGQVTTLTVAAPHVAAVTGAAAAASKVAALALGLLNELTGKSIGLYRATWFAQRDRFGLGIHPGDGSSYRKGDLEFRYSIFEEAAPEP